MDEAKARFIFGSVPEGRDLDDLEVREQLLLARFSHETDAQLALRQAIATQLAREEPPETWRTAQRLLALGLDPQATFTELVAALTHTAMRALGEDNENKEFDPARYARVLDALPVPPAESALSTLLELARGNPGVDTGELVDQAMESLGRAADDELAENCIEHAFDVLVTDGPLTFVGPNEVAHIVDLIAGIVLTHRLTEGEINLGLIDASFDLAGFGRRDDLALANGGTVKERRNPAAGTTAWLGPEGWLAGYPAGCLLAVRVGDDGVIDLAVVEEPAGDPALVARLRAGYDRKVEEPGLPISADELLFGLQFEDPTTFREPRLPLAELSASAGLEVRGVLVAHAEEIWTNQKLVYVYNRIFGRFDKREDRVAAAGAAEALIRPDRTDADLRSALGDLRDPDVLEGVAEEVLADGDSFDVDVDGALVDRLLAAARRPQHVAVARWIAAFVAELQGDPLAADRHLRAAVTADPQWEPAVERAAWYASDKGDAATAAELWRRAGREGTQQLETVEGHLPRPPGRLPGRNEACWCGSGRKFKHCHLGRDEREPLPDRVDWLCSKTVCYLEHQGREADLDLLEYARARAVDPEDDDSVKEALGDPVVVDVALLEGGWFERFIVDRGPLLPEDEALLAQAWALVRRTVYEVVEVTPGSGMVVRDLTTGDRLPVRERAFSTQAKVGWLVCGRAVPDGATHQFVGGLFPVAPGTESELLELCDDEDGFGICEFARRRFLPPILTTTDGDPLVTCTARYEVPDAGALRQFFDARYSGDEEVGLWRALDPADGVVRAAFAIEEGRLQVSTISEARMDWAQGELRESMPGLILLDEERLPMRMDQQHAPSPGGVGMELPDTPELAAALRQFQDDAERTWIREPVPALGGLTPLEAAADPTRVEAVERLIASFPEPEDMEPGTFSFRPDRLRELLGLPLPP